MSTLFRSFRRCASIGSATLALVACDGASAPPTDVAASYRAAPQLDLVATRRYCTDDRLPACQLGANAFASPAPDGGVIIGSRSGPVSRFDSAGVLVADYGQRGGGPGEYERLRGTNALPDGRVILYDGARRRLLFAADGAPIATHTGERNSGVRAVRLVPQGLAVLRDPPAEVGDSVLSDVLLLRDTLPPVLIARLPLTRLGNAMGMSQMPGFFSGRPRWDIESDSTVLLASGPSLLVRRHFRDGRVVVLVRSDEIGNREVTTADIEAERERVLPDGTIPPQMREALLAAITDAEARAAAFHPFTQQLRVLRDGAFLLRETEVRADSVRWTLFGPEGDVEGQLRLAARAEVLDGWRNRLLVILPDSSDVPVVAWADVVGNGAS